MNAADEIARELERGHRPLRRPLAIEELLQGLAHDLGFALATLLGEPVQLGAQPWRQLEGEGFHSRDSWYYETSTYGANRRIARSALLSSC